MALASVSGAPGIHLPDSVQLKAPGPLLLPAGVLGHAPVNVTPDPSEGADAGAEGAGGAVVVVAPGLDFRRV